LTVTYPDPNNSGPATGNGANAGKSPVSVGGDDGRDKLSDAEGDEQGDGGALHEEECMVARDKDEGLGDNRSLG